MASLLVAGSNLAQKSRLRLSFRRPHRPEPNLAEDAETPSREPSKVAELLLWTEIGKKKSTEPIRLLKAHMRYRGMATARQ